MSFNRITQWLDISITCILITPINLVCTWHHTELLQYYWPYSLRYTLHPRDCSAICSLYLIIPSLFSPISPNNPPIHQTNLCVYEFVSVLFVGLFCSLDSTYNYNHMVFVFLWLISLSINISIIFCYQKLKIKYHVMWSHSILQISVCLSEVSISLNHTENFLHPNFEDDKTKENKSTY